VRGIIWFLSRVNQGTSDALPQSPQTLKQLLDDWRDGSLTSKSHAVFVMKIYAPIASLNLVKSTLKNEFHRPDE